MTETSLTVRGDKPFEELKRLNDHGAEYWSARDLQPLLGYEQWRRFENAIQKAITSCKQSGNNPGHHFAGAGKPITGGKGAVQTVQDYHLSRFACYLIAQNGDPRKVAPRAGAWIETNNEGRHTFAGEGAAGNRIQRFPA